MQITIEKLTAFRRELHQHPELSGKEFNTAKKVTRFLKSFQPDELLENLGGTGIAAIYKSDKPGKSILIRCELDALPIHEINDFDYRSNNEDVSHKCGHDGHMTIVAGLASQLHHQRPAEGKVILLFQPAEENGEGAAAILADERFEKIKPDYVFALHNLPSYPKNQIVVKEGAFTAAVNSIIIRLEGKTAHAGEPHNGINPALAIAEITQELHRMNIPDERSENFCIVTPVYLQMGEKAYGISAGAGEAHFTIRCRTNEKMRETEIKTEKLVTEIAEKYNLKLKMEWTQSFFANENHPEAVGWVKDAAQRLGYDLLEREVPFSWGEDFGLFTRKFKGAMFGLGAGKKIPALHNPDYDFPDEITPTGVNMFLEIIKSSHHV